MTREHQVPHGLTVLAAIRRGEAEALRHVLRAIGGDIKGKHVNSTNPRPHVDFARSRTIHFARFAILRDPPRGAEASRLLFSSNYDGTLDGHLAELIDITSDMNAIWGRCDGYQGVASFPAFIRSHAHDPEAFYIAFRTETAETIRRACALRRRLSDRLDAGAGSTHPPRPAPESLGVSLPGHVGVRIAARVRHAVERVIRAVPIVVDLAQALSRYGFAAVVWASKKIIASLNRYPIFRFANALLRNRMPPRQSVYSSVALDNCAAPRPAGGDDFPTALATAPTFREDVITQNQLTLVTLVDPRYVHRVKAVMAAIDSYAKRLAPPGSLIGISTIHFVRWLLVDDNRRLIMLSDYDGSWESYIDEFAEMILSGLDAIWETSFGYPPDGARDLPAFKRFLRTHQVPAEVFYSAYPDQTILNIADSLRVARAVETNSGEPLNTLLPRP